MNVKHLAAIVASFVILQQTCWAQSRLEYAPEFDFGSVGIDFAVFHAYKIYNKGERPVTITRLDRGCDCTSLVKSDSVIRPNDSVVINVAFDTKNQYGPVNKSFKVFTNDPGQEELAFSYVANVGQWPAGDKPDPISLFLLPVHKTKPLVIPNRTFGKISLVRYEAAHPYFDVRVGKPEAPRGENLELEIVPKESLRSGTHRSSLTILLQSDGDQQHILTVPVKIVRY
jgi:hypothetical protein